MCPHCARVVYDENNQVLATNPILPGNEQLNISVIENLANSPLITEETVVRLSGAFSDPLMHPHLLELVEAIYNHMPYVHLRITTNGGSRTPAYVRKVADVLAKWPNWKTCFDFSIDGLADTNGLYRYNVKFERAYANMLAAIESGCRVKWHCLEFPWNSHQLPEIERQANELGVEFEIREARPADFSKAEQYIAVKEHRVTSKKSETVKRNPEGSDIYYYGKKKFDYIEPLCLKNEYSMFIGFDNCVYVCCSQFSDKYSVYQSAFMNHLDFNTGWNDLTKHNINDILEDDRWEQMYESISTRPYNYCVDMCGECK